MLKLTPFVFLAYLSTANALVDTSSGAFIKTWTDFTKPGLDLDMGLVRTYNSRSNFNGAFGLGWCTDVETRIEVEPKEITLIFCGDGKRLTFHVKGSKTFETPRSQDGYFVVNGKKIVRVLPTGVKEVYTDDHLIEIRKNETDYLTIKYSSSHKIKEVADGSGRRIVFDRNKSPHVTDITFISKKDNKDYKKLLAHYDYKSDNLVKAKNVWGNAYSYEYDAQNNLKKATWPGGKYVEMSYNPNNDWITSLHGSNICDESYSYKVVSAATLPKYSVTVTKKCSKGTSTEKTYAYSFSKDTQRITAAVVDDASGNDVTYKYDDQGNVIEVVFKGPHGQDRVTTILRDKIGLITKISNAIEAKSYEYIKGVSQYLVAKTTIQPIAVGVELAADVYTFAYNENDLLSVARKPDGTIVEFKYDEDGRVVTAERKKKDESQSTVVSINYDSVGAIKNISSNGQTFPVDVLGIKSTLEMRAASETYYDFIRMKQLTIPTY